MPTYKFKTTFSRHPNKRRETIVLHYPRFRGADAAADAAAAAPVFPISQKIHCRTEGRCRVGIFLPKIANFCR